MSTGSEAARTEAPLTLTIERVIRASRSRVWAAWTRPELLREWSAPEGLEIADAQGDVREGGDWRVVMQEPDGGRKYIASGTYREVVAQERLVYTHSWETDADPVETLVTIEFYEEGFATRIVFRQEGFASVGSRDRHREGWESTINRLAGIMESGSAGRGGSAG